MTESLYLAWRYLQHHRGQTAVLVACIALVLFLPAALYVVVQQGAARLTARADRTPLLVGATGSAIDLTLSALYFNAPTLAPMTLGDVTPIDATGFARAIPLHLRFQARGHRIVGTTVDYFDLRKLTVAEGRGLAMLGECVLGAKASHALGAGPGDFVLSTPAGAFDVAGSFPLKMAVVGVLAPCDSPDDEAVFVDLKTSWVIAGLAHGHQDMTLPEAETGVLAREEDNVVANASVLSYTEITPENIGSFHFHGDPGGFPIDAAVIAPFDRKSEILLRGRYEEAGATVQMVVPREVVDELVETMFSVRNSVVLISLGLGLATLVTAALVFTLSIRLRRREIETIRRIGAPRRRLIAILSTEILLVVVGSAVVALALTATVSRLGGSLLRWITG